MSSKQQQALAQRLDYACVLLILGAPSSDSAFTSDAFKEIVNDFFLQFGLTQLSQRYRVPMLSDADYPETRSEAVDGRQAETAVRLYAGKSAVSGAYEVLEKQIDSQRALRWLVFGKTPGMAQSEVYFRRG